MSYLRMHVIDFFFFMSGERGVGVSHVSTLRSWSTVPNILAFPNWLTFPLVLSSLALLTLLVSIQLNVIQFSSSIFSLKVARLWVTRTWTHLVYFSHLQAAVPSSKIIWVLFLYSPLVLMMLCCMSLFLDVPSLHNESDNLARPTEINW